MPQSPKKRPRPSTTPFPIRFTEKMMGDVDEVAAQFNMTRQDVIRISAAAGMISLRRIGLTGLAEAVADHFPDTLEKEGGGSDGRRSAV